MRTHDRAFIGFVHDEALDFALVRRHAGSAPVILAITPGAPLATVRRLEQMRLQSLDLELIYRDGSIECSFDEIAQIALRDRGARSVAPLTPGDAVGAASQEPLAPSGESMWIEAVNVGSLSHRSVRYARVAADVPAQLFFPIDLPPETSRLQLEIHAAWPATISFDAINLIDASQIVPIDPLNFEQSVEHFNAVPLELDDRGLTFLCSGGVMVLQILSSALSRLPHARLLELQLRFAASGNPLTDARALRAIERPEDFLMTAAVHLAARVGHVEAALS